MKNENWIRMEYLKTAEALKFEGFGSDPVCIDISVCRKMPKSFTKKKIDLARQGKLFPTTKPDIDNIVKTILDALNGIAFDDDSQIVRIRATKTYYKEDCTIVSMTNWTDDIDNPFETIDDSAEYGESKVEQIDKEDKSLCM